MNAHPAGPRHAEEFHHSGVPPRPESAAPRPARERRLYLMMFDRVYSLPAQLERAQLAAIDANAITSRAARCHLMVARV